MHKEIFSDKETLRARIKEIIQASEERLVTDEKLKAADYYQSKYMDKEEYTRKIAQWDAWPGFSNTELYGKDSNDDREQKLPSIKIVSFEDDKGYENRLFLSAHVT